MAAVPARTTAAPRLVAAYGLLAAVHRCSRTLQAILMTPTRTLRHTEVAQLQPSRYAGIPARGSSVRTPRRQIRLEAAFLAIWMGMADQTPAQAEVKFAKSGPAAPSVPHAQSGRPRRMP